MEDVMIRMVRLTLVANLVLLLNITPSWGQPTYNPTSSDPTTHNTAGGLGAVGASSGFSNTGFGYLALTSNTSGTSNSAFGYATLDNNSTGFRNTACGYRGLISNTTGLQNTATGAEALEANTIGSNNTAVGDSALFNNTDGIWNTAEGVFALLENTGGNFNTAIGGKALRKSTGTKNIGIGYQAGVTLTSGNNNIYIGNQGAGPEFQTIRIGTAQAQTFIAGIGNAVVGGPTVTVDTVTGQIGAAPSSARYKQDIAPIGTRSEGVLALRPVSFAYRNDAERVTHYGLIAEEVVRVYPEMVARTATGDVQAVRYLELIPMLLNELQRQQQTLQRQDQALAEVASLRAELAELRALVGSRPAK
jgi:Chaperone of endosialidase